MKLKVFTLRMNPASGAFDDRELVEFQSDKDIIETSEHFLVHEKTPTEDDLAPSMRSRLGHAAHADTLGLRRSLWGLMDSGREAQRARTG